MADIEQARSRRIGWWYCIRSDKAYLDAVSDACGTTPGYLRQLAYGHRRPSFELAIRLGDHTDLPKEFWLPEAWG